MVHDTLYYKYANISYPFGVTEVTVSNDEQYRQFAKQHGVIIQFSNNMIFVYKADVNEDTKTYSNLELIIASNYFTFKVI